MTTLNNVNSIILNHKKISDVSTSPLILPTSDSTSIQSSTSILTEKSLPLNHSIKQSLEDKFTNPINNNLITYESIENSIQQNSLQFDKILTENSDEEYDLNVCYDVQLDFYNNSTNEKILNIHQIINSPKTNYYISTTSTTPGYSLIYTKDNKFKNNEDNNDEPFVIINPNKYQIYNMIYKNYKTTIYDEFADHEPMGIFNYIIDGNIEKRVMYYDITHNKSNFHIYEINIPISNNNSEYIEDDFNDNDLLYNITPTKGKERVETLTNEYLGENNRIKVIETKKIIYTKLNPYETISENIYNKLLTTNALENTYVSDKLLFGKTLTNNPENIEQIEIIQGDENYNLTFDSYDNVNILGDSGSWLYGNKELRDNVYVYEINEQFLTENLYYSYRWDGYHFIKYIKNSYYDDDIGDADANYIYINCSFKNLKYSVIEDKLYVYQNGWEVYTLQDNLAIFNITDPYENVNVNIIVKIERNGNNELMIGLYFNYYHKNTVTNIEELVPETKQTDGITYDNVNYYKWISLIINYSNNNIENINTIERDNNEVVVTTISDVNNYEIVHIGNKLFKSSIIKNIDIDKNIEHKLVTTDSLKNAYVTELKMNDNDWINDNKNKLVNVNALRSLNNDDSQQLPKLNDMLMNNCYYGEYVKDIPITNDEYDKCFFNGNTFDTKIVLNSNNFPIIYNNDNNNVIYKHNSSIADISTMSYIETIHANNPTTMSLVHEKYYEFYFVIYEIEGIVKFKIGDETSTGNASDTFKIAVPSDSEGKIITSLESTIKRFKAFLPKYINIDDENIIIAYNWKKWNSLNGGYESNHLENIRFNSDKLIIGNNINFLTESNLSDSSNLTYNIHLNDGSMIENITYNSNDYTITGDNGVFTLTTN